MGSVWVKCISTEGHLRGLALDATDLVREMATLHGLKGPGAVALGEAAIGALMISSFVKGEERINLNIRASKGVFQALVDAYPDGAVRGYIVQREISPSEPLPDDGVVFSFEESKGPWGEGLLSVLRTKNQEREQPYIGTVPLLTGHLAKDLTFYWVQSEQIPSAVGIAVNVGKEGEVLAAGGFLVQAMPGASQKDIDQIETHINEMHSLTKRFETDTHPTRLLSQVFQDTPFVILEEKPLVFRCTCSWERVKKALSLVGVTELNDMLKTDKSASVRCDFCTKDYKLEEKELQALIDSAKN